MITYELKKADWSDSDFEAMGWHDCWIHSVAFDPKAWSFLIDLDYIFRWVEPESGETHYKYWISPATMIFDNSHQVRLDLEFDGGIEIAGLRRSEAQQTPNGQMLEREYTFDCQGGALSLWATGFRQIIREPPVLRSVPSLGLAERGGVCFAQEACAT